MEFSLNILFISFVPTQLKCLFALCRVSTCQFYQLQQDLKFVFAGLLDDKF